MNRTAWILVAVIGGGALCGFACCGGCLVLSARRPATVRSAESTQVVEADEQLQAERLKVIQDLQRAKVLQKIDTAGGSIPKAYVLPKWHTLTLDKKQTSAELWLAWSYRLPINAQLRDGVHILRIRDALTGKDIGTMDRAGLHLE